MSDVNSEKFDILFKVVKLALEKSVLEGSDRTEPVIRYRDPKHLMEVFNFEIENNGCSHEKLINIIEEVVTFTTKTTHPRFFNQFSAGLDTYALAGIWISDILNGNMFTYECAPVFTLMEKSVIREVSKLFGYPEDSDGVFSPGGSLANGYAINIARYHKFPRIKIDGMYGTKRLIIFVSEDGHYSNYKMASLLGIGQQSVVSIKTDTDGRMDTKHLEQMVHMYNNMEHSTPFLVIATAGTTVIGAFDPLHEIALICEKYNMWMHVDAAWGGAAIYSDKYKSNLDGIYKSDSFSWSPQKALSIPQQCSVLMVRHRGLLHKAHYYGASYLFQMDKCYESTYDLGEQYLQCGRKPDVFKFWLMWMVKGHIGLKNHILQLSHRAEYITKRIKQNSSFQLVCEPPFINVCFWFLPIHLQAELAKDHFQEIKQLTIKIKEKMIRRGSFMVSNQSVHELPEFFRFVCCNSTATDDDCECLLTEIQNIAFSIKPNWIE